MVFLNPKDEFSEGIGLETQTEVIYRVMVIMLNYKEEQWRELLEGKWIKHFLLMDS